MSFPKISFEKDKLTYHKSIFQGIILPLGYTKNYILMKYILVDINVNHVKKDKKW